MGFPIEGGLKIDKEIEKLHANAQWELTSINTRLNDGVTASGSEVQEMVNAVVQVYEDAAEQYKVSHSSGGGGDDDKSANSTRNRLHFTNMRAVALAQLFYTDFELRGLEVSRAMHLQAADVAEEEDGLNSQFNAVMKAITEHVTEIDVVKNQIAPCFAPHWCIEMLWSACVAHVCSNQIIQQSGGPEGQSLPDLTLTQLLDLVPWVEFFCETIKDAFPSALIGKTHSKKTYFDGGQIYLLKMKRKSTHNELTLKLTKTLVSNF
jgi:hypothetical protein